MLNHTDGFKTPLHLTTTSEVDTSCCISVLWTFSHSTCSFNFSNSTYSKKKKHIREMFQCFNCWNINESYLMLELKSRKQISREIEHTIARRTNRIEKIKSLFLSYWKSSIFSKIKCIIYVNTLKHRLSNISSS